MDFKRVTQKHPATIYFLLTFLISWVGAFILVAPKLFSSQPIPKMDGILMFPTMLLGPVAASIILIALTEGMPGFRDLLQRMSKWKMAVKWYLIALSIPPF